MAPQALVPDGRYKIRNFQFNGVVANLTGGNPGGAIFGVRDRSTDRFDRWLITNVGDGGNQVTIESQATRGSFANADQLQGAELFGSSDETVWTVVELDCGFYYLQSPDANFIWALPGPDAQIILSNFTGEDNTKWVFNQISSE